MTYDEILKDKGLMALPQFTSAMVSTQPDQTADLLNRYRDRFRQMVEELATKQAELEQYVNSL